jgi:hypothetical protein
MPKPAYIKLTAVEFNIATNSVARGARFNDTCGKIAFLKYLEVPQEHWAKPIPYRIRAGYNKLVLTERDGVLERFVVVSGKPNEQIVWGWMWGYEAQTDEFWADNRWIVPTDKLNDIATLNKDTVLKELGLHSSTVDHPVVNRWTGVQLPVQAPFKLGADSTNTAMSTKMRFAMFEIEWYLKTDSPLMREATALALEDKGRRKTKDPRRMK